MPPFSTSSGPTTNLNRPASPSFLQRLGSLELFNNLLFHRERVYQGLRRLSPIQTSTVEEKERQLQRGSVEGEDQILQSIELREEEEETIEDESMLLYLKRTDMAVSKPKATSSTKGATRRAKSTTKPMKSSVTTTKKRSPSASSKLERASKIRKTIPKANSGRRVNGKGASVNDAFIISDDDDDFDGTWQNSWTDGITQSRQTNIVDSPSSEDDFKPSAKSKNKDSENELCCLKITHSKEVRQLRQQLTASEANARQIKEEADRELQELQRRQSVMSDKYMADLEEVLEVERRQTTDLAWECNYLRREMEAARSCLRGESDLIRDRNEYERLYKEEQDTNADLKHSLVEKDREAIRKAAETAKETEPLAEQITALQRQITDLKDENTALKTASASQITESRLSATPTPSQSSTVCDTEQRLMNMRKTYVTVKRRYDILHSIAVNISATTRSWDHVSFGEFGQYLRRLNTALDENGQKE